MMMKVLLVDDEVRFCRAMKNMIEQTNREFVVVAEAYDGMEALELLSQINPDILITDIKMQMMDGLELIREAKKQKPELITVVLSAYPDYDYTRQALRLQAEDYLLKPVTAHDLNDLLTRLKQKHNEQLARREERYLGMLISNHDAGGAPSTLCCRHYAALLVCSGSYNNSIVDAMSGGEVFWHSNTFSRSLQAELPDTIRFWLLNGERHNERIVLLAGNDDRDFARMPALPVSLLQIIDNKTVPITIVYEHVRALDELGRQLQKMRKNLIMSLVFARSTVLSHKEAAPAADTEIAHAELAASIRQQQMERFAQHLKQLFGEMELKHYTQYRIEQQLKKLVYMIEAPGWSHDRLLHLHLEIDSQLSHSLTYTELLEGITFLFTEFIQQPGRQGKGSHHMELIEQVEQYLHNNYNTPVMLQDLSKQFGLVPSYLSTLFKREKGMSPGEYFTLLRVNKAKEMMQATPDMLLKQVANAIGYEDPLYFSRVFKKVTGQSPSEYLNQ
jgi:two-component system response regulator YesN